jgi:hypothetical protein
MPGRLVSKGRGTRPSADHVFPKLIVCDLDIGADETMLIEGDVGKPARRRLGADETEQAVAFLLTQLAGDQ